MRGRASVVRTVGAFGVAAVLAAGCSSGSGPSSGPDAGPGTTAGPTARSAITVAPTGTPVDGGKLVYALEAETDGFDPATSRWAAVGLTMASAVFDPLATFDADGNTVPYLAESFEPSADYRTWTITLRSGVTFHNGQKLDADAVVLFLTKLKGSPLTGAALGRVDPANPAEKVDDLRVRVNMTDPWVAFPLALTGQGGMVPAPEQLEMPDSAERGATPIGTGPFVMKEWARNERFVVTRNDAYWQQGLPHLDEVEFRPITDGETRVKALRDGDVNMLLTVVASQMESLTTLAEQGKVQVVTDTGEQEELFLMFNMAKAPMDDVRVRRAVAHAIDLDEYFRVSGDDPAWRADGPFSASSKWYQATDFPRYDVAEAKRLVDEYEAEKGPAKLTVMTTDTPDSRAIGQSFADMLNAIGIETQPLSYEQTEFITKGLFGQYDIAYWRQFGSPDPDGDYHWWISSNAVPPGEGRLGLNFARLQDPEIDAALDTGRANPDEAVRKQAYADFQNRLTELVPYVWLDESVKLIAADPSVRDFVNGPLPDGRPSMPIVGGVVRLTHAWIQR